MLVQGAQTVYRYEGIERALSPVSRVPGQAAEGGAGPTPPGSLLPTSCPRYLFSP